jgi:hypothetical protein
MNDLFKSANTTSADLDIANDKGGTPVEVVEPLGSMSSEATGAMPIVQNSIQSEANVEERLTKLTTDDLGRAQEPQQVVDASDDECDLEKLMLEVTPDLNAPLTTDAEINEMLAALDGGDERARAAEEAHQKRARWLQRRVEAILAKRAVENRSKNASKPKSPDGSGSEITELSDSAAPTNSDSQPPASDDLEALLADLDLEELAGTETDQEVIETMMADDLATDDPVDDGASDQFDNLVNADSASDSSVKQPGLKMSPDYFVPDEKLCRAADANTAGRIVP